MILNLGPSNFAHSSVFLRRWPGKSSSLVPPPPPPFTLVSVGVQQSVIIPFQRHDLSPSAIAISSKTGPLVVYWSVFFLTRWSRLWKTTDTLGLCAFSSPDFFFFLLLLFHLHRLDRTLLTDFFAEEIGWAEVGLMNREWKMRQLSSVQS